jgi:hypothetical protein
LDDRTPQSVLCKVSFKHYGLERRELQQLTDGPPASTLAHVRDLQPEVAPNRIRKRPDGVGLSSFTDIVLAVSQA